MATEKTELNKKKTAVYSEVETATHTHKICKNMKDVEELKAQFTKVYTNLNGLQAT